MSRRIYTEEHPKRFWKDAKERLEKRLNDALPANLFNVSITDRGPEIEKLDRGWKLMDGGGIHMIRRYYSAGFHQGRFHVYNETVNFETHEFYDVQKELAMTVRACEQMNEIINDEYELYVIKNL